MLYVYDADHRLLTRTVQDAETAPTVTRTTLYYYDNLGRLTRQTHPSGSHSDVAYDGSGRVTYQKMPTGEETRKIFDVQGRVYQEQVYTGTNWITRATYWRDMLGRITRQTDAVDTVHLKSRVFDGYGRLSRETNARDTYGEYRYDAMGRVTRQLTFNASGVAQAGQMFFYDKAGRMTFQRQMATPIWSGLGTAQDQIAFTYYDAVGRVTRSTQPDGTYRVNHYDAFGQLTKSIMYDSSATRIAVSGQHYDPHLGVVTRRYQIADPGTTETFNATNDPYSDALYTSAGRLTKTIDTLGHVTTYDYDGLGRQVTMTDPIGNRDIVAYDNADRVITRTRIDEDGVNDVSFVTAYEYDVLNRVTKTINQGPDGDITQTADNLNSAVWYDDLGRVTQQQDPAGRQTIFAFDKIGRLTRLTGYPSDATGAQHTDYAYNHARVITLVTYPDDAPGSRGYVAYTYDTTLRLTRINHQDNTNTDIVYGVMGRRLTIIKGSEIDTFAYAPTGQMTRATRGSQLVQRYYDSLGRLTRETQGNHSSLYRNIDYAYDKGANVLTLSYPGAIVIQTSYDALGRADIVKRNGTQIASYDYLGTGGRLKTQIFETGANDVTLAPSYDARGNLTKDDDGNSYLYDRQNLLTRVNDSGGGKVMELQYDALNRLVESDGAGPDPLRNYYDGWRMIEEKRIGEPGTYRVHIWTPGRGGYIDELILYGGANYSRHGNLHFVARHHNYNIVATLDDADGSVVERYDYNPYGRRLVMDADYAPRVTNQSTLGLQMGHQGLFHLDELPHTTTGEQMIYNRYRILNPKLKRWMQRDSLGYVDGMSLYEYVRGRPVKNADRAGMAKENAGWCASA